MQMDSEDETLDGDTSEVEFELNTSEDARTISLSMKSSRPMDYQDLILALEFYLTEITRAEMQRRQPGVQQH